MIKKNSITYFLSALVLTLSLVSCKKETNNGSKLQDNTSFPTPIANFAPQSMIDSLRAVGAKVYAGSTPNIVNGIYFMHPDSCIYDNSPGNLTGIIFSDYNFKFSNQDNNLFTIGVEQKSLPAGILSSTPVSSYISGNGNDFSIFILRTVTPSGITVQQFNVLSGTLTPDGIQNFQNTLYIRSKVNDPNNTIAPAGTIRLFINGASGLAINSTAF